MQVYFQIMMNCQKQLINAGLEVNEKVWRLPLNKNYDKLNKFFNCRCAKY